MHRSNLKPIQPGDNPVVICRMPSGWVQLADRQYLRGYCILMAEPQVISLNALDAAARERFLLDMSLVGDALLEVTGAYRINYVPSRVITGRSCMPTSFPAIKQNRTICFIIIPGSIRLR
jgi:hypothetical protein